MFWVNIVRGSEDCTHIRLFVPRDRSERKLTPHSGQRALTATCRVGAANRDVHSRLSALLVPAAVKLPLILHFVQYNNTHI